MADGADLPRGGADGRQCRFASRWCGWPTGADLPRGRLLLAGDEDMLEKSVHRLVDPRRPLAAGNSTRWRAPWTLFLVLSFWQSYSVCCGGGRR